MKWFLVMMFMLAACGSTPPGVTKRCAYVRTACVIAEELACSDSESPDGGAP